MVSTNRSPVIVTTGMLVIIKFLMNVTVLTAMRIKASLGTAAH